jgi:hypothetical protein
MEFTDLVLPNCEIVQKSFIGSLNLALIRLDSFGQLMFSRGGEVEHKRRNPTNSGKKSHAAHWDIEVLHLFAVRGWPVSCKCAIDTRWYG